MLRRIARSSESAGARARVASDGDVGKVARGAQRPLKSAVATTDSKRNNLQRNNLQFACIYTHKDSDMHTSIGLP